MSNENGWIPWDDRTDLQCIYLKIRYYDDYSKFNDEEIENLFIDGAGNKVSLNRNQIKYIKKEGFTEEEIFRLGRIPEDYIEKVFNEIEGRFTLTYSDDTVKVINLIWIKFQDEISIDEEQQAIESLLCFNEFGEEYFPFCDYSILFEAKRTWEEFDKECSLHRKKFGKKDKISIKPKRQKATKKETQEAADLIVKYFNSSKRKFSLSIVNNYLEKELGRKFDLSSKTFLGKIYAVLYYQKQNIPPRGWTVGRIEEAEKEVKHTLNRK